MSAGHYLRMKRLHPNLVLWNRFISNFIDDGATKLNLNKVFVGGLHYQTTQGHIFYSIYSIDDLIKYFSTFGVVESGSVVYNHENHKSRGFGFIIFKDPLSVQKVLVHPDHIIMGRHVEVKRAVPKLSENAENTSEKTTILVGSSPPSQESVPAKSTVDSPQDSVVTASTSSMLKDNLIEEKIPPFGEIFQEPEGMSFIPPALPEYYRKTYPSDLNSVDDGLHSLSQPPWMSFCNSDNVTGMKLQPIQEHYESDLLTRDDALGIGFDRFKDTENNEGEYSLYSLNNLEYDSIPIGDGLNNSFYLRNHLRSSDPYSSTYDRDRVRQVLFRSSGSEMPPFFL